MTFKTLVYEKRGPIASLTLNRPEQINAFNVQMRDDLWEALFAADRDPEVRAVVLKGAGSRGFCAGADLTEFGTAPSQTVARRVRRERDVFGRLYGLAKPTVVALHGHVIGSGVEIALLCDLRVAASDSRFAMPETSLGLIPAAGGTQTLPRWPGRTLASRLLLAGGDLDAPSALAAGLVDRVVARSRLDSAAFGLAARIARLEPGCVLATREAVRDAWRLTLEHGLGAEGRIAERLLAGGPLAGGSLAR